jgi:acetyl esterase/lipase
MSAQSRTLRYGDDSQQVADVWLPDAAPVALILLLHGGFWRPIYDRHHLEPVAHALAQSGYLVANVEYRRSGDTGTFDDVACAVDELPGLLGVRSLPVLLVGHSAGGHLALWASARHRLPTGSPWYRSTPGVDGVLALAAVSSIERALTDRLGNSAAAQLLGGGYEPSIDPGAIGATGIPTALLHGHRDDRVPFSYSATHRDLLQAGGTVVRLFDLPDAGHFEPIDPTNVAWYTCTAALDWLVGQPRAERAVSEVSPESPPR